MVPSGRAEVCRPLLCGPRIFYDDDRSRVRIGLRYQVTCTARRETAAEKPSFRAALKQRRCLVPIDGFYEWKATAKSKTKQPHLIRLKSGQPLALAGLWETWSAPDGELVESFTILTTDANDVLRPIHDRMPVIIAPEDYDRWLDKATAPEDVQALLRPFPAEGMESYPVSTLVNNPRNESPKCLEPV
jgi:putative SOS response-associated peptidase YedK